MIEDVKVLMLKGEAGNSIVSIEKTGETVSDDIYTITLSDGSTVELSMAKGTGIVSIEKTATVGLVDTYTITLTNGTTTTFDVINGQSYTVPEDGVIYFDGNTIPEGFVETTPPAGQSVEIDDFEPSISKVYSSEKVESLVEQVEFTKKLNFTEIIQTNNSPFERYGSYFRSVSSTTTNSVTNILSVEKIDVTKIAYLEIIPSKTSGLQSPYYPFVYFVEDDTDIRDVNYPRMNPSAITNYKEILPSVYNNPVVWDVHDLEGEMYFGLCTGVHTDLVCTIYAHYMDGYQMYDKGVLSNDVALTGFSNDTSKNLIYYTFTQSAGTSGNRTNLLTFNTLDAEKVIVKGMIRAYTSDGQTEGTTGAEYVTMSTKVGWNTVDGESIPITIDNKYHAFTKIFDVRGLAGGNVIFFETIDNSDSETTAVNACLEIDITNIEIA